MSEQDDEFDPDFRSMAWEAALGSPYVGRVLVAVIEQLQIQRRQIASLQRCLEGAAVDQTEADRIWEQTKAAARDGSFANGG